MRSFLHMAVLPLYFGSANAGTVAWTHWTFEKVEPIGTPGLARGTVRLDYLRSVAVGYRGEVENPNELGKPGPGWRPASSFSGGTIANPPPFNNKIVLNGGPLTRTDVFRFSRPVTNPVMAIFSLGAVGATASIVFPGTYSMTLESGGPSKWYGGSPIVLTGNTVSGNEGNGTIQFNGVFSELQFVTPVNEYSYSVTVGVPLP